MTCHTEPIPHHLGQAVCSLQRAGEAEVLRLLKDALPMRSCLVVSLLAVGAGCVGVRAAQCLDCDMLAIVEPWGAPTSDVEALQGTNLSLYYNESDLPSIAFAHEFCLELVPQLLLCADAVGPGRDSAALLRHLVANNLSPGGAAVVGVLAPKGELHAFLASLGQLHHLTADAARGQLAACPGATISKEVARCEEIQLDDAAQLADVLRLCAHLARPPGTASDSATRVAAVEAAVQRAVAELTCGGGRLLGDGRQGVILPVDMVYFVVERKAARPQLVSVSKRPMDDSQKLGVHVEPDSALAAALEGLE